MAIEHRPNGRTYFFGYGGKRPSGTTIRDYFGTGPLAEWITQLSDAFRQERHQQLVIEKRERQLIGHAAELSVDASQIAKRYVVLHLAMMGYAQHDRGEWRRTRRPSLVASHGAEMIAAAHEEAVEFIHTAMESWAALFPDSEPDSTARYMADFETAQNVLSKPDDTQLEKICVSRVLLEFRQHQVVVARAPARPGISEAHSQFFRERFQAATYWLRTAENALQIVRDITAREAAQKSGIM